MTTLRTVLTTKATAGAVAVQLAIGSNALLRASRSVGTVGLHQRAAESPRMTMSSKTRIRQTHA